MIIFPYLNIISIFKKAFMIVFSYCLDLSVKYHKPQRLLLPYAGIAPRFPLVQELNLLFNAQDVKENYLRVINIKHVFKSLVKW